MFMFVVPIKTFKVVINNGSAVNTGAGVDVPQITWRVKSSLPPVSDAQPITPPWAVILT